MNESDRVYLGIRGHVLALNRGDGSIVWQTKLKGSDFVTLAWEGEEIFAVTSGEAFRIEATSGTIVWHNPLRGWGTGLASVLVPGGTQDVQPVLAEAIRRIQAAAASTQTAGNP